MPPDHSETADPTDPPTTPTSDPAIVVPDLRDGAQMWRIARDSGVLDLNSSYAYLLFCRDFARTCRIATVDGETVGFVLGYRRPERPDCLFVWQVGVDERHRGRGISSRLLDALVRDDLQPPVRSVETTITDDNAASQALFRAFARRWDADVTVAPLIEAADFPDGHDAEPLWTIGPIDAARADAPAAVGASVPDR